MTPIPPNHCVISLQRSRLFGRASMFVRIEAPVVVNPDMVSKKASVKLGINPETMKGMEPNKDKITQLKVTVRNPSRTVSSVGLLMKDLRMLLRRSIPAICKA
jgi:hypothetical protein